MDSTVHAGAISGWLFDRWSKYPLTTILCVATGDVALIALYAVGLRAPVFGEDRAVEVATALLFLAAFVVGAFLRRPGPRDYRILLPVAAGLGILGFLDEISFGARLFGWSMPEMTGGGEFDGAHDLFILTYRLSSHVDPMLMVTIVGGASVIGLVFMILWCRELFGLARRIVADRTYSAMALFIAAIAFSALLDLDIGVLDRLGPLEEIAELNAALALLVVSMGANRRRVHDATAD
ncbi:hypothetical protein [Dongia deserti]|uniref:hypothetical protein n=1 Tax=Dongia deserti TaxID=2268030 RepID=UPI0013C4539E|nr:hypothetical protein [Dongia deserti]